MSAQAERRSLFDEQTDALLKNQEQQERKNDKKGTKLHNKKIQETAWSRCIVFFSLEKILLSPLSLFFRFLF